MGMFPCSGDRRRFRGAAQHAYPAIVNGQDSERAHLRLCPDCWGLYTATCSRILTRVDYDSEAADAPAKCIECGTASDLFPVFVNTYPKGQEEVDYFGHVCGGHKAAVAVKLLIS